MIEYVYVLYESYRDNDNYPAARYDLECVYRDENVAKEEALERNRIHNSYRDRNFKREIEYWERKHAEWQVLVVAGLRVGTREFADRPEFNWENVWFVEEIEVR